MKPSCGRHCETNRGSSVASRFRPLLVSSWGDIELVHTLTPGPSRLDDTGLGRTITTASGDDSEKSARCTGRLTLPNALVAISAGVLLVVFGYVRGREGLGYALWLYWPGQVLIFGTVIYGVISRTTSKGARLGLVVVYATVQSFLRWAYSPHVFTFSDELQHLRTLDNVLATNHLFSHNYSLPVSSRYPGLENVTAELGPSGLIRSIPCWHARCWCRACTQRSLCSTPLSRK